MEYAGEKVLQKVLADLEIEFNRAQEVKMLHYIDILRQGLSRQRLLGARDRATIINKHIYDSLYPLKIEPLLPPKCRLLDLGTGAGFPGIPIKIGLVDSSLYLLDANRRKISFLRLVVNELALSKVFFLPGRAEVWGRDKSCREKMQIVLSRAVAPTATLLELAFPLAAVGGSVILFKGPGGAGELKDAFKAMHLCGGSDFKTWHYQLPTGEIRMLIVLQKTASTPAVYPRAVGKPSKKPL